MATPRFSNVPGVNVEVQDGNLVIPRPEVRPVVVLLGSTTSTQTDSDGNRYAEPFEPYGIGVEPLDLAYRMKNSDGTWSELSKAILEAQGGGAQAITCVNIAASGITSDTARYHALNEAYRKLQNYEDIDIVVPVGAYADASGLADDQNFAYQLANFCYQITRNNNEAIGVIGVNQADATCQPSLSDVASWVDRLTNYDGALSIYDGTTDADLDDTPENYQFYASHATAYEDLTGPAPIPVANAQLDDDGTPIDIGMYISVCAMDVNCYNLAADRNPGYYKANGAATYAGMIAKLPAQEAPTNKVMTGVTVQRPLSLRQLNELNTARYVCLQQKPKGLVVSNAMTGAHRIDDYARSDFVRLTSVRIMYDAINYIRRVGDRFIGGPNNAFTRNALDSAIDEALTDMVKAGALEDYQYSVVSSPTDRVLGNVNVPLTLIPAFEILRINVVVGLSAATS